MRRNDAIDARRDRRRSRRATSSSRPGPCTPAEAGISTDVVRRFGPTIPILGVCLGHQCIGAAYGGDIVRAGRPDARQDVARSRTTARASSPGCRRRSGSRATTRSSSRARRCRRSLRVIASAGDDGEIMAVEHRDASGGRRAVPPRVGGERVRLRDARPLPARRACAPRRASRSAPTARMPPRTSRRDAVGSAFAPPRWSRCGDRHAARSRAGAGRPPRPRRATHCRRSG